MCNGERWATLGDGSCLDPANYAVNYAIGLPWAIVMNYSGEAGCNPSPCAPNSEQVSSDRVSFHPLDGSGAPGLGFALGGGTASIRLGHVWASLRDRLGPPPAATGSAGASGTVRGGAESCRTAARRAGQRLDILDVSGLANAWSLAP
jgi:hypothetical protein